MDEINKKDGDELRPRYMGGAALENGKWWSEDDLSFLFRLCFAFV